MSISIAIVGATGLVGRETLAILDERMVDISKAHALASRESLGREVSFGDRTLKCEDLERFDFSKVDLVFLAAGGDVAREWAPKIAAQGAYVIDNSSAFRMDPDVPLVVPEVNPDAILQARKKRIIANPNCSTAQLVVALKPIHDRAVIKRVVVATYQSASGAGQAAMDELWQQTKGIYVNDPIEPRAFNKQIAFNLIPQIDVFMEDGSTKEEWKMLVETKKILDPSIKMAATCVRVPVFVGHSEAVTVELGLELSAEEARTLLRESPGIMLIDNPDEETYVTPVESVGEFAVFVSRVREDPSVENGLQMWVVADNLRKGAALNTVQIAELMIERGMFAA